MTLEVRIDRDACIGSGNCSFWAAGVFELGDDGIARVVSVEAEPEEKIVLAANGCPSGAISLLRGGRPVHAQGS